MSVRFNHTIVWCRDQQRSATFLADILGLPAPTPFGPFQVVHLDDGASLDFDEIEGDIASHHYAFLIDEGDFDPIFGRIRERGIPYWADPGKKRAGRDLSPQRRARGLLRRPGWSSVGDPHAAVCKRRVRAITARAARDSGESTHWSSCHA